MNLMQAVSPLAAAWLSSVTGGYDAVLIAVGVGATVMCVAFWVATLLTRARG